MKEDFQNCLRKWQEPWDKGVQGKGEYLEGYEQHCAFYCNKFLKIFKFTIYFDHLLYSTERQIVFYSTDVCKERKNILTSRYEKI